MAPSRYHLSLLAVLHSACASDTFAPEVISVVPSSVHVSQLPTQVSVTGLPLELQRVSLDDSRDVSLEVVQLSIGGIRLESPHRVSPSHWVATIPTTVGVGAHDVDILISNHRSVHLDGAFTVRDATLQPMVVSPSVACNDGALGDPALIWPGAEEDDFGPSLSADRLTLLFARVVNGYQELFTATRDSVELPFDSPSRLEGFSGGNNTTPVLSWDGLHLYFASDRSGDWDIWGASRFEVTSQFGNMKALSGVNTRASELRPWLDATQLNLYFESDRNASTGLDVWRATRRSASETFESPLQVAGMADVGAEGSPSLTPDGLTMLYLADTGAAATRSLYQASRTVETEPFSQKEAVPLLDSFDITGHAFLSADGRELVFSAPYEGRQRLWSVLRNCD